MSFIFFSTFWPKTLPISIHKFPQLKILVFVLVLDYKISTNQIFSGFEEFFFKNQLVLYKTGRKTTSKTVLKEPKYVVVFCGKIAKIELFSCGTNLWYRMSQKFIFVVQPRHFSIPHQPCHTSSWKQTNPDIKFHNKLFINQFV